MRNAIHINIFFLALLLIFILRHSLIHAKNEAAYIAKQLLFSTVSLSILLCIVVFRKMSSSV